MQTAYIGRIRNDETATNGTIELAKPITEEEFFNKLQQIKDSSYESWCKDQADGMCDGSTRSQLAWRIKKWAHGRTTNEKREGRYKQLPWYQFDVLSK